MAGLTPRYWAFLSYSHADEAMAARLHKALESYVLPARVRRAHALPRRLIPIFRDAEELAASSSLTARLQDALADSRWLVVLCSPAAAKSRYVNDEVEHFLRTHGAERLLCALLEGEPAEAFPAAIRALPQEPLAADLRPGADFDAGKLQLVAALAGVGFGELRNREAARRRRQQFAAAAFGAGLAAGGLGYWDLFAREHVDYYGGYVREYGIWQGVDPLDAATVQHRAASYRFVRHGRLHPPERVDYYKGCGTYEKPGMVDILRTEIPNDAAPRDCAALFRYHSDGSLAQETLVSAMNVPRLTLTYTEPDLAQLTEQGFAAASSSSGIYYVQFRRDAHGRDERILYLRAQGEPRPNAAHVYGYAFAYDAAGHVTRESGLDDRGGELGEVVEFSYGPSGVLARTDLLDAAGSLRNGREGYARAVQVSDPWGNTLKRSFFDAAGHPATNLDGVASLEYEWDGQGNRIVERNLDGVGQPVTLQGVATYRSEYDDRGFRTHWAFFGPDGKPVEDNDGAASYLFVNDAYGNNVENRLFDTQGQPTRRGAGMSIDRKKFDERGNQVEEAFFDADDKPVMLEYGAIIRDTYDARGNITSLQFFDTAGRRYLRRSLGCAVAQIRRDDRGNGAGLAFLGTDLQPIIGYRHYASLERIRDDNGNIVEMHYYGLRHEPIDNRWGFSIRRARFNRSGSPIEIRYFDAQDRPVMHNEERTWGWTAEYDARGNMVRKAMLDASGKPGMVPAGFARIDFTLDALGSISSESYFDAAGRPVGGGKPAMLRYEYDSHHREQARRYFEAANRPVVGPDGYAALLTDYNEHGQLVAERCFDAAGRPVERQTGHWATHRIVYENRQRVEHWFNAAGREIPAPK